MLAVFVVTFGLHLFRMKTDPYYRFKAQEAEEEHQTRQHLERLRGSQSEAVRGLAEKLGPRK